MKLFVVLLMTVLFLSGSVSGYMDSNVFMKEIQGPCYEEAERLTEAQPRSLEYFLDLLERFENDNRDELLVNIIEKFLNRFEIEGLVSTGGYIATDSDYKEGQSILHEVVSHDEVQEQFNEDSFNPDEKCALHYILSYTVNNTFREGIDDETTKRTPPSPTVRTPKGVLRTSPLVSQPREMGVVSLRSNDVHAFSLGRVLAGIYLGLLNLPSQNVRDIIMKKKGMSYESDEEEKFEPLYAFTVADILTFLRFGKEKLNDGSLGPNGKWSDPFCPVDYKMSAPAKLVSFSLLRGAIDGLILGTNMKTIYDNNNNIKLSQILRMYYSNGGVSPLSNPTKLSYCKRQEHFDFQMSNLQVQILYYAKIFAKYKGLFIKDFEDFATKTMNELKDSSDNLFLLTNGKGPDQECSIDDSERESNVCETRSDVIFILDTINEVQESNMLKTVKEVISDLDLSENRGTVTVFSKKAAPDDLGNLESIVYRSNSTAEALCKLRNFISDNSNSRDEKQVINILNNTLTRFKNENKGKGGQPALVVVYFNYDAVQSNDKGLKNAVMELLRRHRDVPIYAVGAERKVLETYVRDKQLDVIDEPSFQELTKVLKQKICETPAILKYPECRIKKDNEKIFYEGLVAPNKVQYFKMYPEYFHSSTKLKVTFETREGDIMVCDNRSEDKPENYVKNCKTTEEGKKKIELTYNKPCDVHVSKCSPLHFAVIGSQNTQNNNPTCTDDKCRRTDEIVFTVKYKGARCTNAACVISSTVQAVSMCLGLYVLLKSLL